MIFTVSQYQIFLLVVHHILIASIVCKYLESWHDMFCNKIILSHVYVYCKHLVIGSRTSLTCTFNNVLHLAHLCDLSPTPSADYLLSCGNRYTYIGGMWRSLTECWFIGWLFTYDVSWRLFIRPSSADRRWMSGHGLFLIAVVCSWIYWTRSNGCVCAGPTVVAPRPRRDVTT